MKLILDTHCHTVASGHAYSTIQENAKEASNKGLKLIAITDHAPKMPGSTHIYYFNNIKVVPNKIYGVEILKGVEANIMDYKGNIDMSEEDLRVLDIVIASLHPPCFKSGTVEENTNAVIGAIENPYVNIIGHPDDGRFPIDYRKVVKAAKDNGVLLEINNSSLNPNGFRENSAEIDKKILELCIEYNNPVVIGSDCHISYGIGNFDNALILMEEIGFSEELVVNTSVEKLKKYLNK